MKDIWNNKKFYISKKAWIYLIVVEILILIAAGFFYSRRESVMLNFSQEELVNDAGDNVFYLDRSTEQKSVTTPAFMLTKGMYTLEAQIECVGEARLEVVYEDQQYDSEVSGMIPLSDRNVVTCDFRINYADRPIQVRGVLPDNIGEGEYILVRNIRITNAACAVRNTLFWIFLFMVAVDGALYMLSRREQLVLWAEKTSWKVVVIVTVLCSMPLMVDYLFLNSHDLYFHLMRIEGIKEGMENGMFPVRIQPGWLSGHGYAASVFYGDLLLYFPAFLRFFGISVQAAYKCYVVLINLLTVSVACHCFGKMGGRRTGLICASVYSMNIYRLTCIYTRAAVGEYTAMTFMPLVLYGLWKLYTLPEDTEEYKNSWFTIAAGCTGIFLSHMITTEITALFVIISAVIMWRKLFRKKAIMTILKSITAVVLLNLWFLVPFLDYMISGTYVINNADKYMPYQIEKNGAAVAQLFMTDYNVFGHSSRVLDGSMSEMPMTVGAALMLVPVGWFCFCLCRRQRDRAEKKTEYLTVFLSLLSLWMSTYLFPYTWLADRLPFLRLSIVSVQYLWRFLSVAAVMLSLLLCLVLQKEWILPDRKKVFAGVVILLSLWQGMTYMSRCVENAEVYRVQQTGNMSTMQAQSASKEVQPSVMGGEYLPLNWNEAFILEDYVSSYTDQLTCDADSIHIAEWSHGRNTVTVSLLNMTDEVQQIEVPLLLYKGYQAVTDQGEALQILPGTSYRLSVSVPAGFSGEICVKFKAPWYWRVCEMISLMALICVVLCGINHKGKKLMPYKLNFQLTANQNGV